MLISDPDIEVSVSFAMSKQADASVIQRLLRHPDKRVRWWVPFTPTATQRQVDSLVTDPEPLVRQKLAQTNSRASPQAVLKLFKDPVEYVRKIAADNPKLPSHLRILYNIQT